MCEPETDTETKGFEPVVTVPVKAPFISPASLFVVTMLIGHSEFTFVCQDAVAAKQIQYAMAVRYWPVEIYGSVPDDMDEVIKDFFDETGDNYVSTCERPILVAAE